MANSTHDNLIFFWSGPFSQWFSSSMVIDNQTFNCCEQWMMFKKAELFLDESTANKIMATTNPYDHKKLGRKVRNYDDATWMKVAYDIVVEGNRAKFSQNSKLLKLLLSTKGKLLVEASPYDKRWGIGMREGDQGIEDPKNWKGQNLLGKAITGVRIEMFGE